jgi:hypothetical protein
LRGNELNGQNDADEERSDFFHGQTGGRCDGD